MIKSSWQSYQFKMMKSLTSLPPSSASAARPSPWSYSPKQILFFLKFDCESLEGIKASSPSSSGPPAASCASSGLGGEACHRASSPSCWLLSRGSGGSLAPDQASGVGIDLPGQRALEGQKKSRMIKGQIEIFAFTTKFFLLKKITCLYSLHGEVTVEGGPLHMAGLTSVFVFLKILGTGNHWSVVV